MGLPKCSWCTQVMHNGPGCTIRQFADPGRNRWVGRIRYGKENHFADGLLDPSSRCPDCATPRGSYHHANCDQEECPSCGLQALGCGCDLPEAR